MTSSIKFNDFELKRILGFVQNNLSQKQIQEKLNLRKNTLFYRLKRLQELGYLTKIAHTKPCFFELTEIGKSTLKQLQVQSVSDGVSHIGKIKTHNVRVTLDLVQDLSTGFWEDTTKLNNWVKSHRKLKALGVTLERTTKSIVIIFHPQHLQEDMIIPSFFNGTMAMIGFLDKHGIKVDPWSMRISSQEYSIAQPLAKPLIDKGTTFRQFLGHPVQRIMARDEPKPAYAQIDASEGRPEIDTNDLDYAKKLVNMPYTLESLFALQATYAENLNLHLKVMQGIDKVVRKLDKQLSQKSIKEFI